VILRDSVFFVFASMRALFRSLLILSAVCVCSAAHALPWNEMALRFSAGSIAHPLFSVRDVRLETDGKGGRLTLEKLDVMGQVWPKIHISCGELRPEPGRFSCRQGRLDLAGRMSVALRLEQAGDMWRLLLQSAAGRWELRYEKNGSIRLDIQDGTPDMLSHLVPALAPFQIWQPGGVLNGHLRYEPQGAFSGQLVLSKGVYNSPDGLQAAENLEAALSINGRKSGEDWCLQGSLEWRQGAVYSDPVLLKAGLQRLEFTGEAGARGWKLETASLHLPRAGTLVLRGEGDWQGIREATLSADTLALKPLGETLLTPLLAGRGLPKIDLSGRLSLAASWQAGAFAHLEVKPDQAGLMLDDGRLALEGVNGHLAWRSEGQQASELRVDRLALGRLESGAFRAPLMIWPQGFALTQNVTLPLLDGELSVNHLAAGFDTTSGEWEGALGFSLSPMSLDKLTQALDMPIMRGLLSANLPLIRYQHREATLDGALVTQVFDGYLNCADLRLIDPLGMRPRILADVNARHIDLEQLTQTFSFGQITGFVDVDLKNLELAAGWRPQAFQASVASSPGRYRRRISQKAVDNITSLGGGGTIAAIQKSALRFFQDIGYRNIGISCQLENGVCNMAGIAGLDRGEQYTIVEGGGIPALTVMGYNRRVDWEELLGRIKAATQASAPVIQ
jgi:hypothetical protein